MTKHWKSRWSSRWSSRWTYGTRRWIAGLIITLAFLTPAAFSRYRTAMIKPGSLSTPHAQILANRSGANACTSCHQPTGLFAGVEDHWKDVDWSKASVDGENFDGGDVEGKDFDHHGGDHRLGDMTDRCMNCHWQTIDRSTARSAHHFTTARRRMATDRSLARLKIDQTAGQLRRQTPIDIAHRDDIHCSVCHQEHHGDDPQLTAMTDAQCQSCHSVTFASFSNGHPQWENYPVSTGRSISFDHQSHLTKHYPETIRDGAAATFDCRSCHRLGSSGEPVVAVDYQTGCASCHDQTLQSEMADGLTLLALPSISRPSADQVGDWPLAATGFSDRGTSDISEWLIDPKQSDEISLAKSRRQWLIDFANGGQSSGVSKLVERGITRENATSILGTLSPQIIDSARSRWFSPNRQSSLSSAPPPMSTSSLASPPAAGGLLGSDDLLGDDLVNDDLLGDDLLANDPLADDLLADDLLSGDFNLANHQSLSATGSPTRFRPWDMLARGGWYRDDTTMAIRYAATGHADPVLTSLIQEAVVSDHSAAKRWAKQTIAESCLQCHPGAAQEPIRWKTVAMSNRSAARFSHRPHLQIASLVDCQSCHQIKPPGDTGGVSAFTTMKISDCASCHHDRAAGQSCTQCHDYHHVFSDTLDPSLFHRSP